jgi:hypothetical protein
MVQIALGPPNRIGFDHQRVLVDLVVADQRPREFGAPHHLDGTAASS